MSGTLFYLHEDEWGMISLEPRENYDDRRRVVAEARAHSEAHRAPGGAGWSAIYVAPEAPVTLATRAITPAALHAALGRDWQPYDEVASEYISYPVSRSAYAFRDRHVGADFENVIYGCLEGEPVGSICVTRCERPLGEVLHRLGATFRLILCDLWRDEVVDLADRLALERYLADEPELTG